MGIRLFLTSPRKNNQECLKMACTRMLLLLGLCLAVSLAADAAVADDSNDALMDLLMWGAERSQRLALEAREITDLVTKLAKRHGLCGKDSTGVWRCQGGK